MVFAVLLRHGSENKIVGELEQEVKALVDIIGKPNNRAGFQIS